MTSRQAVDTRTPVDFIEPILNVQEAGRRYLAVLEDFATTIHTSLARGNITSVSVAFWSGSYALGLKLCDGMSMRERAEQLGVERATISKNAMKFVEDNRLPPSFYMKDEPSGRSYVKARLKVLSNGHGKNGGFCKNA